MHRIGGKLRTQVFGFAGAAVGIPLLMFQVSNQRPWNRSGDNVRWAV